MTSVNTTNWMQGPWVSNWTPGDGVIVVHGSVEAPIGASLCKSGSTTGWICGVINAKNESVTLSGVLIQQLTRHSACVERGDSGGSNLSGNQAQGVSSDAVLYGASARCGAAASQPTISWFQPINEVLSTYGYTLITG
jgi:streptogrisin C